MQHVSARCCKVILQCTSDGPWLPVLGLLFIEGPPKCRNTMKRNMLLF